jgi:Holliday junction resolvasome RuvABC endonuclease subunit
MVKIENLVYKPQTILAIDASTNSLAFSLFDGKDLTMFGKINFNGSNTYQKVVDAGAKVKAFMAAYNKPIDAIVIEHTVFMNSPKTAADLALVQGAILGAAGVSLIRSVAPITWQNFIGNKKPSKEELAKIKLDNPGKSDSWIKTQVREARKQKTIHFVDVQYGKVVPDNDVADAIGIGHYAINNWERLTK